MGALISGGLVPQARQGSQMSGLMHVTDWFPTILELAGIEEDNDDLDGMSQVQGLMHTGESARTHLLYDCYHKVDNVSKPLLETECGVRNEQYKLLHANSVNAFHPDTFQSLWYNETYVMDDDTLLNATIEKWCYFQSYNMSVSDKLLSM